MNASDPLAQLHDIQLPEPVGFWPPAPLYWLLALALLALVGWGLYCLWRKRKRRQYRQQALALLTTLPDEAGTEQLQKLNQLLKRTAINAYGEQPAALSGKAWLTFLDETLPDADAPFCKGPGQVLATGPYQPEPQYAAEPLLKLATHWINQHREARNV
ncbi:MAG TPA: DUF4381 domain-containing protein [Cellvibrionaceae bacterium]